MMTTIGPTADGVPYRPTSTIATIPLPPGSDVMQFDPGLGRIYVACSSGTISIFQEDDLTISASWPTCRCSAVCTVSRSMCERIGYTHPNRRRTGAGLPGC